MGGPGENLGHLRPRALGQGDPLSAFRLTLVVDTLVRLVERPKG